ncbi:MAG: recombination protein O N-terminal domain-containing protein [Spirochaetaceae bacterium]|jgi:DNA repair protein RecO (recombination protein O)|nr:recombination protein O N-terminal domain-containing protein [Spirochaetaceae bacterium]
MNRNIIYHALVLRVRQQGEANRDAVFLTAEDGIIHATVFGGPKSKLRSYISPGHSGVLYVYHENTKDYNKASDFDVQKWRPGIRENYKRSMAEAAILETIIETHGGGGSWLEAMQIAEESLDALDTIEENNCKLCFSRFLYKWCNLLGLLPEDAALILKNASAAKAHSYLTGILEESLGKRPRAWDL